MLFIVQYRTFDYTQAQNTSGLIWKGLYYFQLLTQTNEEDKTRILK